MFLLHLAGGGIVGCNLNQKAALSASLVGKTVSFDGLGKKINDTLNRNDECKELPWKEGLKNILDTASTPSGTVDQEAKENCLNDGFCFYSFQTESAKGKYKLFIKKVKESDTGEIIVIKKWQQNEPSYYEGYPDKALVSSPGWQTAQRVNGDKLSSSAEADSEGSKIVGRSIKYPNR